MEFTPQEIKLIDRLRREERQWPRTRWLVLGLGIVATVCAFAWSYFAFTVARSDHANSGEIIIIAFIVTKCFLSFLFAVWCFAMACWNWHGDAKPMLLLRLLEAQQKLSIK